MPGTEELIKEAIGHAQAGRLPEAIACAGRAVAADPGHAGASGLMGTLLHAAGRAGEAVPHLERAHAAAPGDARLAYQLGAVLMGVGQSGRGLQMMARAVDLEPAWVQAMNGLATALYGAGDFDRADEMYRRSLATKPGQPEAMCGLAGLMIVGGRVREAVDLFREAGRQHPGSAEVMGKLLSALNYADDATPEEMLAAHRRWGELVSGAGVSGDGRAFANSRDPERKLRIGLLSPDLYDHSCAYFLRPLIRNRDRSRYEVVCYAAGGRADWMTDQLRAGVDSWREVGGVPEQRLVDTIRADGVDVLIELAGHTALGPLAALRRRAAPVQATYLGYPNTTGLSTIDYRIVDEITDPPGAEAWHTERLVRLPGCFLCYSPSEHAPPVTPAPCAATGRVTFGSFNSIRKIGPATIDLWSRVLSAVPGSRLLLKTRGLGVAYARRALLSAFAERGIAAERIEMLDMVPSKPDHMGWYGRVDIGLDTFPYNGTTTTCEALWMGVPVVSLRGGVHAARVGASLLSAAGMPEFVAGSPEEYARIAARLAAGVPLLASTRAGMREALRGSVLLDGAAHAGRFFDAVRVMWRAWCAGA